MTDELLIWTFDELAALPLGSQVEDFKGATWERFTVDRDARQSWRWEDLEVSHDRLLKWAPLKITYIPVALA
jgi:hypothetical protein